MVFGRRNVTWVMLLALAFVGSAQSAETPAGSARGVLSDSAQVRRDRPMQSAISGARERIARGDVVNAVTLLQEILDQEEDAFVVHDDRLVGMKAEANRMLAALPRASLEIYERQYGAEARTAWQQALFGGETAQLIDVCVRYRNTAAGLEALRGLASRHFDEGRFALAAAGFQATADHPLCDRDVRTAARARMLLCWHRLGEGERAAAWLGEHGGELDGFQVPIAGKATEVTEWLAQLQEASAADDSEGEAARFADGYQPRAQTVADPPSLKPMWERDTGPVDQIAELIDSGLTDLKDYGTTGLDSFEPMPAGELIIARTMQGLTAIHARTGETAWEKPLETPAAQLAENLKRLENKAFRGMISELLVSRIAADSISGRPSTDGRHVFVVHDGRKLDVDSLAEREFRGGRRRWRNERPELNTLCAFDVRTGKELWTTERVDKTDNGFGDVYFLGAPLPAGERVYVLGRRDGHAVLYCLRIDDGTLDWSLPVADVSGPGTKPQRLLSASPLAAADGVLVCPTSAGAVVAVDLLSRSLLWAARYERVNRPKLHGLPRGRRWEDPQSSAWGVGWRSPATAIANGRVMVATGEMQSLAVFDLHTGKTAWLREHPLGLYVAGADAGRVVVVEKYAVRGFDLDTGRALWTAAIGVPSGRGVFSDSHYILPLETGGVAEIRLADGAVRLNARKQDLGNLAAVDGRVVSQTYKKLVALDSLPEARARALQNIQEHPDDEARMLDYAFVESEAGEHRAAAGALTKLIERGGDPAKEQLRAVLFDELGAHPERIAAAAGEIGPFLQTDEERVQYHRLAARAHRMLGETPAALAEYLSILDLDNARRTSEANPTVVPLDETIDASRFTAADGDGPRVLVRNSRFVQGEIADLIADGCDPHLAQNRATLDRRLGAAVDNPDPFALAREADAFGTLSWGRDARLQIAQRGQSGADVRRAQLGLMELADGRDPQTAAIALGGLGDLMAARSYLRDAAASYRKLLRDFADVPLEDGRSAREFVAARTGEGALKGEVESGPSDPWPLVPPKIAVQDSASLESDLMPVPVEAEPGTLFDRLGVYLARVDGFDRTEWQICFQGDGQRGYWRVDLPATSDSFRALSPLHAGWGLGHILILKLGTEIYGIAPLDENGEANAKILWRIDTLSDVSFGPGNLPLRMFRPRLGFGLFDFVAVDRFGYALGRMGPVRAGFVCYLHKGMLIAIDPLTGERLWQRYDIPADAQCSGDDEVVLLYGPDSKKLEVLRAVDGKLLARRELDVFPRDFVNARGRRALVVEEASDGRRIAWIDLVSGREIWSRSFLPAAVPFRIDPESFGILDPKGSMQIVQLKDGKLLSETGELAIPKTLTGLCTSVDEQRLFVALSGPFANAANMRANEQRYDFRGACVNGPLYAFDRRTGILLWKADLADALFPLDQPKEAPLLVLDYARAETDAVGSDKVLDVIRCLDKRTGRIDYQHEMAASGLSPWILETDVDQKRITLRITEQTVRFEYSE